MNGECGKEMEMCNPFLAEQKNGNSRPRQLSFADAARHVPTKRCLRFLFVLALTNKSPTHS